MSGTFTPNRLIAGTTGAGRFTYKTHSESNLELEGDSSAPGNLTTLNDDLIEDDGYGDATLNADLFGDDAPSYTWNTDVLDVDDEAEPEEEVSSINSVQSYNTVCASISPRLKLTDPEETYGNDIPVRDSAALVRQLDQKTLELMNGSGMEISTEEMKGLKERVMTVNNPSASKFDLQTIHRSRHAEVEELTAKVSRNPNSAYTTKWKRELLEARKTAIVARVRIRDLNAR